MRLEIHERADILEGKSFGDVGAYEKIRGIVHFALDPDNPANAAIVDLALAPRNDRGMVEAHGDFEVLRPKDSARGSGTALLEVSNRGGKASLSYFNGARRGLDPGSESEYGDGFLMRRGMTVIWVGWQFDVPRGRSGLRLNVPVARANGGGVIEGPVRCDWTVDRDTPRLGLGHRGHTSYAVADPDGTAHVLTERDGRDAARRTVPREEWSFVSGATAIRRNGGFRAGKIYELVYRGQDPAVVGIGLAAIRDMMSFARNASDDACPFGVDRGIAVGISQTGRFLRHFLYQGFNTDERGRKVFDGVLAHSAGAGRGSFNHRFAQPSRDAHRYSAFFYPTDIFPFTGKVQRDAVTARRDGLLAATRARGHLPRIFFTNTGYEYWGRAASLLHTSLDGSADVDPLPEVRIYHLAGTQHFPFPFRPDDSLRIDSTDAAVGVPAYRGNPIDFLVIERALLAALQDWVERDVEPPATSIPRIADATLVAHDEVRFPSLPGIAFPRVIHEAYRTDLGPRWNVGIVDNQPPRLGATFPSLVSQVDDDGNERGGIRPLELQVPLATYAPWHIRNGLSGGNGELTDFFGTFIPFAATRADRKASGDPRPSLDARYPDKEAFLEATRRAARKAIGHRHLLAEDLDRVVRQAEITWNWITGE